MFDSDFVDRFEKKLLKGNGCWNWQASCAGKGYGQMKLPKQRKQEYSHRLAYMIYKGPIPDGIQVCHTCDNPKCCNPDHLFLGTSHDNHLDMKEKGRGTLGVKNARAKLTNSDIKKIRKCLSLGMSQTQLSKAFGVSQTEVSRIHRGERWAHVT